MYQSADILHTVGMCKKCLFVMWFLFISIFVLSEVCSCPISTQYMLAKITKMLKTNKDHL